MKKAISLTMLLIMLTGIFSYSADVKQVSAESKDSKKILIGGEAFGIRMFSDGVLVIEVEENLYGSSSPSPASKAGIKVNDIIKTANGVKVSSNERLTKIIKDSGGDDISLSIDRDGKNIELILTPCADSEGIFRVGIWVKDSAAGIGTITYYDTQTKSFGALGHGICEAQTGTLIPMSFGEVDTATISDITKSQKGSVGSLNGYFENNKIGYAENNLTCGIYGKYCASVNGELTEIATKSEVKTGSAQIYCTVSGNKKEAYDIKILRLKKGREDTMIIEITDPELIELTGGIVQGMSGSPIVQNGKLIGAVTHVLVNDPTKGYGIYIEDMLAAAG